MLEIRRQYNVYHWMLKWVISQPYYDLHLTRQPSLKPWQKRGEVNVACQENLNIIDYCIATTLYTLIPQCDGMKYIQRIVQISEMSEVLRCLKMQRGLAINTVRLT